MVYKAKKINLEHLASLIIKKSEDEQIHVSSDSMEEIKITCIEGKLSICGIPTNEASLDYSASGVSIKTSRSGGISVSNVSGKNVSIINSQVWIDGKLVAGVGKDVPASKPTIVHIPDGVDLSLISCLQVTMDESHQLKEVHIENADIYRIDAQTIICDSASITCTGSSVLNIRTLKCPETSITVKGSAKVAIENLDVISVKMKASGSSSLRIGKSNAKIIEIETSGSASCKVQHADHGKSLFQTSGASTLKVEGLLTEVVATSSGMSTCKFSTPRNQPFITKKGMATCKAI